MSGDWRKAQQTPMRQNEKEPNSPFMRTAFGYSPPTPPSPPHHSPQGQLPRLSPQPASYQTEHKNTPTSVLMPTSETPQQLRGRLMTIQGEQRGESWFLNRSHTSLGRALDNDIVLLDIAASRKHAQIIRGPEGFILLDLRSANGIFLNGRRITEEDLYDGDEIEVGETILKFETVGQTRVRSNFAQDDTDPGMTAIPHQAPQPIYTAGPAQPPSIPSLPQFAQPILRGQRIPQSAGTPMPKSKSQQLAYAKSSHNPRAQQSPSFQKDRASSRKENHLTYGFGSQLSPQDLNLAPLSRTPRLDSSQWQDRLFEYFHIFKVELTLGRGHRATILRISVALSVIIIFFALGQGINSLISSPKISSEITQDTSTKVNALGQAPQSSTITDHSTPLPKIPQVTQVDQNIIQQLNTLLARQEWAQTLKLLHDIDQPPSEIRDPRLQAFRSQAEQVLIQKASPLIKTAIEKGTLSKAQKLLNKLQEQIALEEQVALIPLKYALWLHQRNLGDLKRFNPPPREQKLLARAAKRQESGQYRTALKILKRARPSKTRSALFELRKVALEAHKKSSAKRNRTMSLKDTELKYLLVTSIDIQSLLQRYKAEIEKAVIKTQYKQIAPWLEGAIILSLNQPLHQYFLNKQQKLKREAIKWLAIANSNKNTNNLSLRRALLESAIPYLEGQNRTSAKSSLRRLR